MAFLPDGKLAVAGGRPGQEGDVRIYDLNAKGKTEDGVEILDGVNDKVMLKQSVRCRRFGAVPGRVPGRQDSSRPAAATAPSACGTYPGR